MQARARVSDPSYWVCCIVVRALGPSSLGIFSIADEASNLPATDVVAPINGVLFPSYAQLAGVQIACAVLCGRHSV